MPSEEKARNNTLNPQYPGGTYFTGFKEFRDETLKGVIFVEGGALEVEGVVDLEGCLVHKDDAYTNLEIVGDPIDPSNAARLTARPLNTADGVTNTILIKLGGPRAYGGGSDTSKITVGPSTFCNLQGYVFSENEIEFRHGSDGQFTIKGGLICGYRIDLDDDSQISVTWPDSKTVGAEVQIPPTGEPGSTLVSWEEW